jgi:hypothetical protein
MYYNCISMRVIFILFSFIIFTFISCIQKSSGKVELVSKPKLTVEKKTVVQLKFGTIYVTDTFFSATCFLNGDSIQYAGNKEQWAAASIHKQPAWCFADSILKEGVLYNYFVITDRRRLTNTQQIISITDALKIQNAIKESEIKLDSIYHKSDFLERSYKGNFYNLNYVTLWIEDTLSSSDTEGQVLIIDVYKNRAFIEKANSGNGFRLITLSKN